MARGTVQTEYSPKHLSKNLYEKVRGIYQTLCDHDSSSDTKKPMLDESLLEEVNIYSTLVRKFEDSFVKMLYKDAQKLYNLAKKEKKYAETVEKLLEKIEAILKEFKKEEHEDMRKSNYLRKLAGHLRGKVRKEEKEVRKIEKNNRRGGKNGNQT